jgi:hypothetical protein
MCIRKYLYYVNITILVNKEKYQNANTVFIAVFKWQNQTDQK